MEESPYEHIKHGTFTRQFKTRPPHLHHLDTLHKYASYIVRQPQHFHPITRKRALFYLNLIEHHGPPGSYHGGTLSVHDFKEFIENSYLHKSFQVDGFVLDKDLSMEEVQVYFNDSEKRLVIVFRGTSGIADWVNNASYIVGRYKHTNRFKTAERIFHEALAKYPSYTVTLVGHSQGAIPEKILNDRVHEKLYLNPAWTSEHQTSKDYIVKSSLDPVSLLVRPNKNNVVIPAKTHNPIHEHSTKILDILPQDKLIGGELTADYPIEKIVNCKYKMAELKKEIRSILESQRYSKQEISGFFKGKKKHDLVMFAIKYLEEEDPGFGVLL